MPPSTPILQVHVWSLHSQRERGKKCNPTRSQRVQSSVLIICLSTALIHPDTVYAASFLLTLPSTQSQDLGCLDMDLLLCIEWWLALSSPFNTWLNECSYNSTDLMDPHCQTHIYKGTVKWGQCVSRKKGASDIKKRLYYNHQGLELTIYFLLTWRRIR